MFTSTETPSTLVVDTCDLDSRGAFVWVYEDVNASFC